LGKSKDQKEAEALDLERQRQQVEANSWMAEFSKELAAMSKDRFAKEQAYLENEVDPALKGYAQSGFAPGEERRLRAEEEERTARINKQQSQTTLGNIARAGFKGSGTEARARLELGTSGAESRVAGQREISRQGSEGRRAAVGMQMQRAGLASGAAPLAGVASGRPRDIRQAKFGKGFWGKLGGAVTGIARSAVGAISPFKWGGGGGGGGGGFSDDSLWNNERI